MNIIRVRLATVVHVPRRGPREAACLHCDYRQSVLDAYGTRINLISCFAARFYARFYVSTTWGKHIPIQQTFWGDYE